MKTIGDYQLTKFLGKGTFGETYLAQKGNDSTLYAAKILDKKKMDSPSLKKYFDREIEISQELLHPNIVHFYEKLQDETNYYLIIEYCNGGTLTECIEKYKNIYKEPFNIEIIQNFMRQIISAFCHIHSKGIIHRDVKLDNILLSYENEKDKENFDLMKANVKVIDFGVARKLNPGEYAFTTVGSPITMSPLLLKKYNKAGGFEKLQGYNEKADIWSLGTIFYQLLTGNYLFRGDDMKGLMQKVEEGNYVVPINKNFSKESINFLNCMLQYNPEDRTSVQNLAQFDFIKKNVKDFTKPDFNQLFNKIDKNGLNINVKKNDTIFKVFNNSSEKQVNRLLIHGQNESGKNSYSRANTYQERGYLFNGDIFYTNRNPHIDNFEIPDMLKATLVPQFEESLKQSHRFSKGNVSPSKRNPNKELKKFEEEIKESIKLYKKSKEKKKDELKNIEIKNDKIENNNNNEKEEVRLYIKGLLEEYKAAKEYFNKNVLYEQEKDTNEKYIKIESCLSSFEKGESIVYDSLPKPITPEYIYGCSISKRNSVFQEIINEYKERQNELISSIKNSIIKYKKWNRDEFLLVKNAVMAKLEKEKIDVEKWKHIIELLQEKNNNEWIPAPEITKKLEKRTFEKISFENCIYKLKIHLSKINYYNTDNFTIKMKLKIDENKTFRGEFKVLNYGDFEEDIIWNLNYNEWNNLSKYFINIDFFLYMEFKGNQKINIIKLKDEPQMNLKYPISFINQPTKPIINLNITVDIPEGKVSTINGMKEIINIKKYYPAFEGKSPYTNKIPNIFLNSK